MGDLERSFLCAIRWQTESDLDFQERLAELEGLCSAAGASAERTFSQARSEPHRALYLGTGKIQEIAEAAEAEQPDLIIFDAELSPAQIRNLESRLQTRVIDRTQLILDIFAARAQTKEGRLQVEIAQLQYLLPRLTGRGVHMSRLGGGIGTRGPGETQLETDRRRIRERVDSLRQRLESVRKTRETNRRRRINSTPVVALVGYTNAGKTTLLKRWLHDRGGRSMHTGNQRLFDTLDPLARKVKAGTTGEMVVMDTVGFVQNLPHLLVEAFQSTLEEVNTADVIVQVVDGSGHVPRSLDTTYSVLEEIHALDKPVITFFNKADIAAVSPAPDTKAIASIYGSAKTGDGLVELYHRVETATGLDKVQVEVTSRLQSESFWHEVLSVGRVIHTIPLEDNQVRYTVETERRFKDRILEATHLAENDTHIAEDDTPSVEGDTSLH